MEDGPGARQVHHHRKRLQGGFGGGVCVTGGDAGAECGGAVAVG